MSSSLSPFLLSSPSCLLSSTPTTWKGNCSQKVKRPRWRSTRPISNRLSQHYLYSRCYRLIITSSLSNMILFWSLNMMIRWLLFLSQNQTSVGWTGVQVFTREEPASLLSRWFSCFCCLHLLHVVLLLFPGGYLFFVSCLGFHIAVLLLLLSGGYPLLVTCIVVVVVVVVVFLCCPGE